MRIPWLANRISTLTLKPQSLSNPQTIRAEGIVFDSLENRRYIFSLSIFIKREVPVEGSISWLTGKPIDNWFLAERFKNEAAALQVIHEEDLNSCPRPQMIWPKGKWALLHLEAELVHDMSADITGEECWLPSVHGQKTKACSEWTELARPKCDQFVSEILHPPLRRLESNCTGLNGMVNPQRFVLSYDDREIWKSKESA